MRCLLPVGRALVVLVAFVVGLVLVVAIPPADEGGTKWGEQGGATQADQARRTGRAAIAGGAELPGLREEHHNLALQADDDRAVERAVGLDLAGAAHDLDVLDEPPLRQRRAAP